MNTNSKIIYDELPALYRASDKASITAQNQFVVLTSINLGLMLMAAIAGSLTLSDTSMKTMLAITSAILLTIGIFVTIIIRTTKLERVWYDGRAIAESVKTLAWRYMTGCDPYSIDLGSKADEMFISSLHSLLVERKTFAAKLGSQYNREQQITDKMRIVRSLGTDERKRIYLSERIDEQRKWYSGKTEVNLISANRMFMGTIASQALAIIFAFTIVVWQGSIIKLTGVFTTLAAAFMAWTQMRRNEEQAQSYGLATQELNFIFEQSSQVRTEKELSTYVVNSENAISREHTMWLARRS
jgi:hypothetical protein